MPSFKELYNPEKEKEKQKEEEDKKAKAKQSAAAAILSSHTTKDKRISVRVSNSMYAQFAEINQKLGASNGSVINTLMSQYVREHKDILNE